VVRSMYQPKKSPSQQASATGKRGVERIANGFMAFILNPATFAGEESSITRIACGQCFFTQTAPKFVKQRA